MHAVDGNGLMSVREIRFEPGEDSVRDAEGVLKSGEENRVVYGVKGSGEVKECEERNFTRVSRKEEIVDNAEQSCFSTMVLTVG